MTTPNAACMHYYPSYYYTGNLKNVQYVSYPIQVVEKWPQDGLMLAFHWEL